MQTQQSPRHPSARATAPPVVAVVATTPNTVQDDIARAMQLAGADEFLPAENRTLLKVNISWQHWYPGCSSTPWQIEGVANALRGMGHTDLVAAHNGTVVVDSYEGEENNRHKAAQERAGLPSIHLDSPPNRWIDYKPQAEMLALDDIFPEGIQIPECFPRNQHRPSAYHEDPRLHHDDRGDEKRLRGLLHRKRHWTHSVIHETLVDLLAIQQEIHPGLFAVMDGTFAGDGPGPRAMRWHVKNRILASADQVAIDAVAAKMMGFDPMSIPFIRLAHERGLGCGEVGEIDVRGEDISGVNWEFSGVENTFASRGQKLIYWGPLKPLENMLLRSPIVGWAFLASNLYHNGYWLKTKGRRRIQAALKTEWGRLFQSY